MRLPHWLRCRFSRWTTYEHNYAQRHVLNGVPVSDWAGAADVRQWRECLTCGKRQDRLVHTGPLGNAVPRQPSPRS